MGLRRGYNIHIILTNRPITDSTLDFHASLFKARLHVNGSGRNEYRFQQNLTVYTRKFCKGMDKKMARSSENRGTDKNRLHVVFFETGTDRARDMKLQRLVRMRLRPYLKRSTIDESFLLFLCLFERREHELREQ